MLNFRIALIVVLLSSFAIGIKSQTTGAATNAVTANSTAPAAVEPLRKQAIEGRYFSKSLVPLSQVDGAVPGSKLMEMRRQRAAAQLERVRSAGAAHPMGNGNTTTILPGLQFRANEPAGGIPSAVITGDFNRDGHMDFIVANSNDNNLWIYLGKGDGTFELPQIVPLSQGLGPSYLATADLRGSGKLDLVVAEYDSLTIGVLLGNGDGTFGYEQSYTLPESPSAVVIGDFNHDGKLDIAASMQTTVTPTYYGGVPYLAVLTGDGAGHFNAPTFTYTNFYSTSVDLAAADVNGDGFADLLVTGLDIDNSTIWLNAKNGTFTQGQTIMYYTADDVLTGGQFADVNEDGCLDAIVSDLNTGVWVALGDCKGDFTGLKAFAAGDSNAAVRLADVNGDGHLDILTTSETVQELNGSYTFGNSMNVMLGDGKGNFGTSQNYQGPGEAFSLATAAFKDGGLQSVVTANSDTDTATVFLNNGSGNFGFPQGILADTKNYPATGLSFTDLNGDGKADIFAFSAGSSGDWVATTYLNDGTGTLHPSVSSDAGISSSSVGVADYRLGNFRGTGHLDAVAIATNGYYTNSTSGSILFMPGNGDGSFGKGTATTVTGAAGVMAVGDFNGDGKLDFVAANGGGTDTLTTFLGNGDGTFHAGGSQSFTDGNEAIARAFSGDFNRDGKLDVLVFTTTNGYWTTNSTVWEFLGNGDGTFQAGKKIFTGFQPMTMADLNGDGHPDIVRYDFMWPDGQSETFGPAKFTNYLGQADGSFLQSSSYAPYSGIPHTVSPYIQSGDPLSSSLMADLNGDGKPDEVALQEGLVPGGYYSQVLMGNGDGTFTPTYNILQFYGYGSPIYAHDMDGDGITDMVEMDPATDAMYVLKGAAAPALQLMLNDAIVMNRSSCGVVFADVASASARTITFLSSITGVLLPASVPLPANSLSASFCYTLSPSFNSLQVFDVNATLDGSTATAYASSVYTDGFSEAVTPTTTVGIYAGQSTAPVTITLTSAGGYSSTVTLSCPGLPTGDSCQFANNPLALPPNGSVSTTVVISTVAGAPQFTWDVGFTIAASDGNVTQRQTVEVPVATLGIQSPGNVVLGFVPGQASDTLYVSGLPPYNFSCSGLPAGATCSFSGTQNAYPSSSNITMAVNMSASMTKGVYPLTIQVASGGFNVSSNATLYALGLNVVGPPASNDWVIVGSTQSLPLTLSTTATASGYSFLMPCTLDVAGTCSGAYGFVNATPYTTNLTVNIPAGVVLGQHNITITGTLNGTTQSATVPFYVVDFSGSLSTSAVTMKASTSSTLTATLIGTSGFNGQVSMSCSYIAQVTCSFNPSYPQLNGTSEVPVTVTINTSALASLTPEPMPRGNKILVILAALLPMAWLLRRRRSVKTLMSFTGLFLLTSLVSCSSGGPGGSGGGGGGTTTTYTVTVNATAVGTSTLRSLGTVTVSVTH